MHHIPLTFQDPRTHMQVVVVLRELAGAWVFFLFILTGVEA
jgi:hypothetical protein